MNCAVTNSGPFGTAQRGTISHILNALNHFGVPLGVSQGVRVGQEDITLNDRIIAKYKYFEGISQPLFFVYDTHYMRHPIIVNPETGTTRTVFRLSMTEREVEYGNELTRLIPNLIMHESDVTPEFREFIKQIWSKVGELDDVRHTLSTDSGAIFNGIVLDCGHINIEFWNSKGAQAFVDYVNNNYTAPLKSN
jgi:hypothetical protein